MRAKSPLYASPEILREPRGLVCVLKGSRCVGGVNRVRARRLGHGQHSTPACPGWGMVVFDPEVWIRDA
eukprot:2446224-Pleurochrysis_carterae.AAC.1